MKLSYILLFTLLTFTVYAQENLFFKTRLQIFAEAGNFGAGSYKSQIGKGLSVAVTKPLDPHIEVSFRAGLRMATSDNLFTREKYYNIDGDKIIENSITNLHLGTQLIYSIYVKHKNAFKIKLGASFSQTKRITFKGATTINDNNPENDIYEQYHDSTSFIDYTGGVEYERKINDRLSAGLDLGYAYKEEFPFGSLVFGVAL